MSRLQDILQGRWFRFRLVAAAIVALCCFSIGAWAQDRRQNEAGNFDYYVLTLSWSPSFCEASTERGNNSRSAREQCGARPFSFVVHGLWPQYDKGYPEFCQVPAPRLYRGIVTSMLDLMPSPQLIFHEWDRHGTCSGLPAKAYFDNIRRARAVVKIPDEYLALNEPLTVTPQEVETAFVKANPGLMPEAIAIDCRTQRLDEVQICMSKELGFRSCGEANRRSCRRDKLTMPPVRGG
jgi:ribonuclease T2